MINDKIENLHKYIPKNKSKLVLEFIKTTNETSHAGEYKIDGEDIFARILTYETKVNNLCNVEAHEVYIDIQFTLFGEENIRIYDVSDLPIKTPYDKDKDVKFYQDKEENNHVNVENKVGYFTLINANEVHSAEGNTRNNIDKTIKKCVIKIKESCYV